MISLASAVNRHCFRLGFTGSWAHAVVMSSLMVLTPGLAHADPDCTRELSRSTEGVLTSFGRRLQAEFPRANLWPEFHTVVVKYGVCDDGALGEMYSALSIGMLRDRWEDAQAFPPLQSEGVFRRFVIRHVDATVNLKDLRSVRWNAKHRCGRQAASLCREVARACKLAISDMNQLPAKHTDQ
jgi:hypothetical protein